MDKINEKLGTSYHLFDYYGADDADRVVVCMGSFCDTLEEVIDYERPRREGRSREGPPVPSVVPSRTSWPRCPRPSRRSPCSTRTKEPGSIGEPLYQDVITALYEAGKSRSPSSAAATASAPRTSRPQPPSPSTRSSRRMPPPASSPSASWTTSPTSPSPWTRTPPTRRTRPRSSASSGAPRRRRHRRRQQELDQDHRRPHRQVRPGLLPVRLQEDRRRHDLAPALR